MPRTTSAILIAARKQNQWPDRQRPHVNKQPRFVREMRCQCVAAFRCERSDKPSIRAWRERNFLFFVYARCSVGLHFSWCTSSSMYADKTKAVKRVKKMTVLTIYATSHNWRCVWVTVNNESSKHHRALILMSYIKKKVNYFGKPENNCTACSDFYTYTSSVVGKRGS